MREKLKGLKSFDWRLFAALCALGLIPAAYQTVRTFIIASNGSGAAFDVIGQMEWFDLINETLQAFLIVPLYSVLNKILKSDEENFAGNVFKTGLSTFVIYALFSVGVFIYGRVLTAAMNPAETDLTAVNAYLRLETVAFSIGILTSFANVVFVVIGKSCNVYVFLAIRTVLSIIADCMLIPAAGIYGVAVSNIVVNSLLAATSFLILYLQKYIKLRMFRKSDLATLREWVKVGAFSGLQQFVDNFIYAVMVCKMVNAVSGQGNYWIANNFIWGWLLIPITALSEVIRRDCKDGYCSLKQFDYYFVAASTVVLWTITIPLWTPFFRYVENLDNADEIFSIVIKLVPFYVAYAGCAIVDNIFVGLGKTVYNAINSLIINFVYYGIFYVLYRAGVIIFDMNTIILMFGFGMVTHLAISLTEEKVFLKRSLSESDCR